MNVPYTLNSILLQNNTFSGLNLRQNLIVLEEVTSTNDYLKLLLSNIKPLAEGTAIMTKHQSQGRGQRGTAWLTKPEENLTVSFLLYPNSLPVQHAFNLNILVSLGVHQWLTHYIKDVYIKWPNDIFVGQKKIGGILIENQLRGAMVKSSIVGIGININQQDFPDSLKTSATSLKQHLKSAKNLDIEACCRDMLTQIFTLYKQSDLKHPEKIRAAYTALLLMHGKPALFEVNEKQIEGTIQGVDSLGRLIVLIGQSTQSFDLKEIRLLI
ncbi:Biotin--protein ligase [Sphingobacterium sp. JB170]|nr:Biotin--protein ligase [Sphingobacterium sp. JB170]